MPNTKWIKVTTVNKPEEGKDYVLGWYTDTRAWLSVFGFCDDGKIDNGEYLHDVKEGYYFYEVPPRPPFKSHDHSALTSSDIYKPPYFTD